MQEILKLEDISAYYGSIQALEKINLEVNEGEIVALLGANGAGKSTTLKVITGLLNPENGRVVFSGENITGETVDNIVNKGITHVPEGRRIFPELSVKENLKAGSYSIRKKDESWQEKLPYVFDYFPVLEDRQKQKGGTLSGGEQQMLAIARGLMAEPELMLLDEPSLGLAPLIVEDIFEIIKEINKAGTTVFIVEQNATLALELADRAYVMETGNIVESGSAEELAEKEVVKEAYLGREE